MSLRVVGLSMLLPGLLLSCAKPRDMGASPVRFDRVTEFILKNEFFATREGLGSPVGSGGRACEDAPLLYVTATSPSILDSGDQELDRYRAWSRSLARSWMELLTPTSARFSELAQSLYCEGNTRVWEQAPATHDELGRVAFRAFTSRVRGVSLLDLVIENARCIDSPPRELPRARLVARKDRRELVVVVVAPPTGPAEIFKYCMTSDGPAVTLNTVTPELAACAKQHYVLLEEDPAYAADYRAWEERVGEAVRAVSPSEGAGFQDSMYTDLRSSTDFFPRLLSACAGPQRKENRE